jgi:hypothetical protein
VNRKGITSQAALEKICDAVRECAAHFSAVAHCPDLQAAESQARELDAYCSEVDIAIGVNVVAPPESSFAGTRIRILAEGAGFKLEPDGVFHFPDDARQTLFTLDNHEPAPFLPEQIKHLTTSGRHAAARRPSRGRWVQRTRSNAENRGSTRDGARRLRWVDDNRVPLEREACARDPAAVTLDTRKDGSPRHVPGSERALRLFA